MNIFKESYKIKMKFFRACWKAYKDAWEEWYKLWK